MDVFCITLTLYKVSVLHPEIDRISESRKPGVSEDKKKKQTLNNNKKNTAVKGFWIQELLLTTALSTIKSPNTKVKI